MDKFVFRHIRPEEYGTATAIYNSNRCFLRNHLDMEAVDEAFIVGEIRDMQGAGFISCVAVKSDDGSVQAVLDYRPGEEVYLSLLMLPHESQGRGVGREIYACFEAAMRRRGSMSVRIDVVNDYAGNMIPFWAALGFEENGSATLKWGNKTSCALVMRKQLAETIL